MNADEFVNQVRRRAPSLRSLLKSGLSKEAAEAELSEFFLPKRNHKNSLELDPILDLIDRYDVSTFGVGMVRFTCNVKRLPTYTIIGEDEADPIVIDSVGCISVRDISDLTHVVTYCAKSSELFLEALIPALEFLTECASNETIYLDNFAARRQAEKCSNIAGGKEFMAFYSTLLSAQ